MPDYRRMYFQLAGKVADAIELLTAAALSCEETALEEPPGFALFGTKPEEPPEK